MSAWLVIIFASAWMVVGGAFLFLLFYNLHVSTLILSRLNATLMNRRLLLRVIFAGVAEADKEMQILLCKLRLSSVLSPLMLIGLGFFTFWPFVVFFLPLMAMIAVIGKLVCTPVEMPESLL